MRKHMTGRVAGWLLLVGLLIVTRPARAVAPAPPPYELQVSLPVGPCAWAGGVLPVAVELSCTRGVIGSLEVVAGWDPDLHLRWPLRCGTGRYHYELQIPVRKNFTTATLEVRLLGEGRPTPLATQKLEVVPTVTNTAASAQPRFAPGWPPGRRGVEPGGPDAPGRPIMGWLAGSGTRRPGPGGSRLDEPPLQPIAAAQAPVDARSYAPFDVIFVTGGAGEYLQPAQVAALAAWTEQGGQVVIAADAVLQDGRGRDLLARFGVTLAAAPAGDAGPLYTPQGLPLPKALWCGISLGTRACDRQHVVEQARAGLGQVIVTSLLLSAPSEPDPGASYHWLLADLSAAWEVLMVRDSFGANARPTRRAPAPAPPPPGSHSDNAWMNAVFIDLDGHAKGPPATPPTPVPRLQRASTPAGDFREARNCHDALRGWSGLVAISGKLVMGYLLLFVLLATVVERWVLRRWRRLAWTWPVSVGLVLLCTVGAVGLSSYARGVLSRRRSLVVQDFQPGGGGRLLVAESFTTARNRGYTLQLGAAATLHLTDGGVEGLQATYLPQAGVLHLQRPAWSEQSWLITRPHHDPAPFTATLRTTWKAPAAGLAPAWVLSGSVQPLPVQGPFTRTVVVYLGVLYEVTPAGLARGITLPAYSWPQTAEEQRLDMLINQRYTPSPQVHPATWPAALQDNLLNLHAAWDAGNYAWMRYEDLLAGAFFAPAPCPLPGGDGREAWILAFADHGPLPALDALAVDAKMLYVVRQRVPVEVAP